MLFTGKRKRKTVYEGGRKDAAGETSDEATGASWLAGQMQLRRKRKTRKSAKGKKEDKRRAEAGEKRVEGRWLASRLPGQTVEWPARQQAQCDARRCHVTRQMGDTGCRC